MTRTVTIDTRRLELAEEVTAFISAPAAEARFNQLALALFAFQYESVPIYRQFCERKGVAPGKLDSWQNVPALPVSAFKEFVVSSLEESDRSKVFHSSGTTGQMPSRHFHSATSIKVYETSLLAWFEHYFPATWTANAQLIFLTPPPAQTPHSSLVHMFETIERKFGDANSHFVGQSSPDGSWSIDFQKLRNELSSAKPVYVFGTAFSFVHWLDHLSAQKLRLQLPADSRLMETGGYKGRSRVVAKTDLRRLMTKFLGVPDSHIFTEYGMSELSSQAYAGPDGILHFPPWARTQIISPESGKWVGLGETGLLRIFDLANIYSVSALQTEDLGTNRGDGFELIGRATASEPRGCSLMAAT